MIQVIIENPKTGKSYTCKSYSETTKDITYYHITYSCILRHKDHPFFKQFYHGPNGMQTGSERYKEIQELEKSRYRCTTIQATRANYHGNTPRRTY